MPKGKLPDRMPKGYSNNQLQQAVGAVNSKRLTISQASREFSVPRMTISDHVKNSDMKITRGPGRIFTDEEESGLVNFCIYMASQGFPLTRDMIRCYVKEIIRRTGRTTLFNVEKGPSDNWFRKLLGRHPELSEKMPEQQDRARNRMSNENVIDKFMDFFEDTLKKHGLEEKPAQIFNCDETGWSGKEGSRRKVVGVKRTHTYQQRVTTSDHVTAHLCVSADGRFIPSMIIFQGCLPHRQYKDGIPGSWLFGTSESGYMDKELFYEWFVRVFIPNCGNERPVILLLDNHDSHISLPVIEAARSADVVIVGLPGHTTHILQPLDVKIIGPLKKRFASLALSLGFASPQLIIGKAKFSVVLQYAIDQTTAGSVKEAFKAAGIYPVDRSVLDQSQLVPQLGATATSAATSDPFIQTESDCSSVCDKCGSFLTNPLVTNGLIPESLADVLMPPPGKSSQTKRRKIVQDGRVISGDGMLMQLQEREQAELKKQENAEERKRTREKKREEKKILDEEKLKKRKEREEKKKRREASSRANQGNATTGRTRSRQQSDRLAHKRYTCGICKVRGRVSDESNGIHWYGCDADHCRSVSGWFHLDCLADEERLVLTESIRDNAAWLCEFCRSLDCEE